MPNVGDIKMNEFKVGNIDLTDPKIASYVGVNIYEDILSPITKAEVRITDYNDMLGKSGLNGKEDVSINFEAPFFKSNASFKLKILQNKNLDDGTQDHEGALHAKQYDLHMVSPEHLNAQANYVQKSYKDLTSNMVKDIVKTNFKSKREVKIPEETKIQQRIVFSNHHPYDAMNMLLHRHVSSNAKSSSLYTLFPSRDNGVENFIFATFDYLMEQASTLGYELQQILSIASLPLGQQQDALSKNLLWFNVPQSFENEFRWNSSVNRSTYNRATGKMMAKPVDSTQINPPKNMGDPIYNSGDWDQSSVYQRPRTPTLIVPHNDQEKTYIADAKSMRRAFMGHLSQNSIDFEVLGNPNMKVGDIIPLKIPKKIDGDQSPGEDQIDANVLITNIRHKIRSPGINPGYSMVVRAVKAAFKIGGGSG